MDDQDVKVTKIMAATPSEFASGLARLAEGQLIRNANGDAEFPWAGGIVRISYTQQEGRRLSPLLTMPRSEVTFRFQDIESADREAFIEKFDKVFQRGGG